MIKKKRATITLLTIVRHLQTVKQELLQKIDGVKRELSQKMDVLEAKVDRHYRNLTTQIDGIDQRLDEIEVERLPKIEKVVLR